MRLRKRSKSDAEQQPPADEQRPSADAAGKRKRGKRGRKKAAEGWYHNVPPLYDEPASTDLGGRFDAAQEDRPYEEPSVQVTLDRSLPPPEAGGVAGTREADAPSESAALPTAAPWVETDDPTAAYPPSLDMPPWAIDPQAGFEQVYEDEAPTVLTPAASEAPATSEPDAAPPPEAPDLSGTPGEEFDVEEVPGDEFDLEEALEDEPEPDTPDMEIRSAPEERAAIEAEPPAPQRPFVEESGPPTEIDAPTIIPIRAYYMTRAEDTLRSVAAQFLNSPARWLELRSLNSAHPGVADAGADELLAVDTPLALPGDPTPWGKPDPVHLWTLAETFLFMAWGREPAPEEVAPFWRGLSSGAAHLGPGGAEPPTITAAEEAPAEPPIPPAMLPPEAPPAAAEPEAPLEPVAPAAEPAAEHAAPPAEPATQAAEPPAEPVAPATEPPPADAEAAVPTEPEAPAASAAPAPAVSVEPDTPASPGVEPQPGALPQPAAAPEAQPPAVETPAEPPSAVESPRHPEPAVPGVPESPSMPEPPAPPEQPPPVWTAAEPPPGPSSAAPPAAAPQAPEAPAAERRPHDAPQPPPVAGAPMAPPTYGPPPVPQQPPPPTFDPPPPAAPEQPPVPQQPPPPTFDPPPPPVAAAPPPPVAAAPPPPVPQQPPPPTFDPLPPPVAAAPPPPTFDPLPPPVAAAPPPPVTAAPPPPAAPTYGAPPDPATDFEPMPGTPDLGPAEPQAPREPEAEGPPMPEFMPSLTGAASYTELPAAQVVASTQRALAGTAIGDAVMLWQLGRLRRRSGRPPSAADPLELSLEQTARMDSLRLIEASMRHLRATTVGRLRPKPRVVCIRTGTYGFEVLLEEPIEAPEGWQSASGGYVLELTRGVTFEQLDAAGQGPSLCPTLVPVGDTAEGPLLLNIEEIGCLAVSGPPSVSAGLLTSIVEVIGSSPLAGDVRIIAVDVGAPSGPGWERIHTARFDSPQLEHLLSTALSPAHALGGAIDVLVVGPGNDLLFQRAAQIATTPGSRLILVGATSSAAARWPWRINVDENLRAVVHPIAVDIMATQAMKPDLAQLLTEAAEGTYRPPSF